MRTVSKEEGDGLSTLTTLGYSQGLRIRRQAPPEYKPPGVNESSAGVKDLGNKQVTFLLLTHLLTISPCGQRPVYIRCQ